MSESQKTTKNGNGGTKNGTKGAIHPMSRAGETRLLVPLSAILPSPDKLGSDGKIHFEEAKLEALRRSFDALGDWTEAIHVVPGPKPGTYYQWQGHYRLQVLREKYGADHKVAVVVEDLTPQMRLQRMAEDNGEAYGDTPVSRAEVVSAGVRHFADRLPALVEQGAVPAIPPNAPRFYDAKSKTPFQSQTGTGSGLPPFAYTSGMLAAYVFQNERSVQRSLAALNGADRLGLATAEYMTGLQRDDAEYMGRVMAEVSTRTSGKAPTEKTKTALRSLNAALRAKRDGADVSFTGAEGKAVDIEGKESAAKLAQGIGAGSFKATVTETAKSAAKKNGKKNGTPAPRKAPAARKRAQVSRVVDALKKMTKDVAAYRVVTASGMQWKEEELARVREAAQAFVDMTNERIAKATKTADVTKARKTKAPAKKK